MLKLNNVCRAIIRKPGAKLVFSETDQWHQASAVLEKNLSIIYTRIVKLKNVLGMNVYIIKYEKICVETTAKQLRTL